jgi:hypothetical protein
MRTTLTALQRLVLISSACASLVACSSADPVAYSKLASSAYLQPNDHNDTGRIPYLYSTPVDWANYTGITIEPVQIYHGSDQQFEGLSDQDKGDLMNYMQAQFTEQLQSRFPLPPQPGTKTLRLQLTLTGAATTTPVLGTLSRFDLAGGIYNGVQTARDREGTLTGSVLYSVEIYDAQTNRLLYATIEKQYPSPWSLGASIGSLAAAKAGIKEGAMQLAEQLK